MSAKNPTATTSRYFDDEIVGRQALTDRLSEFLIAATDGTALSPGEAGSHIEIRFQGPSGCFLRHYSLVEPLSPAHSPEPSWRIAVQRENRPWGSAFIHDTFRTGMRLQVSYPVGTFRLVRDVVHTVLAVLALGQRQGENLTMSYEYDAELCTRAAREYGPAGTRIECLRDPVVFAVLGLVFFIFVTAALVI